jgi:hypothetical protein
MTSIYLNRKQAAHYVNETWGMPCSYKWLAKLVVTGGGPKHWKWGRAVRYQPHELDAWVSARTSGPFASSNEARRSKETFSLLRSGLGLPFVDTE